MNVRDLAIVVAVLTGVVVMSVGTMLQIRSYDNDRAYVQAVCDWSHTHTDGALEQRCAEAQDKTNTEYLCLTRSSNLSCWVEAK